MKWLHLAPSEVEEIQIYSITTDPAHKPRLYYSEREERIDIDRHFDDLLQLQTAFYV